MNKTVTTVNKNPGVKRFRANYAGKSFVFLSVLPAAVFFLVFFYYPFAMNLYYAFTKYNYIQKPVFIGLKNFMKFFTDKAVLTSFEITFIITVVSVPLLLGISILFAMVLYNLKIGKALIRSGIFSTYVISGIVAAIIFKLWFSEELGIINNTLAALNLPPVPWFTNTSFAVCAIILLGLWKNMGYYIVILMAGLSNISKSLYEASEIDGANKIKQFLHITIPQLKPTLVYCMIIATINYIRSYAMVVILTEGRPYGSTKTILMYMFEQGFDSRNVGYASVIAIALFLGMLAVTLLQLKAVKFDTYEGV